MSCNQTLSGLTMDCGASMGGIVEVYIANHEDISGITEADGKVSVITPATASAKPFHKYAFRKETGSLTSTLNVDNANGVNYVSTDLVLVFGKMDTTKRTEIAALSKNELIVVAKDCNGVLWYLGHDEAVMAAAGDGQTGTARGDANRYSITLRDNSYEFPMEVSADIEALVA